MKRDGLVKLALLIGVILIILLLGSFGGYIKILNGNQGSEGKARVPVERNKGLIIAKVTNVSHGSFPRAELTIHILASYQVEGYRNFATEGETITAHIAFVKSGAGEIIWTAPFNIKSFAGYYLLPKDIIRAEVRCEGGNKWEIFNIERLQNLPGQLRSKG